MTNPWTTDQITAHATSLRTTHGENVDALTIAETADDHGITTDGWRGADWDAYIEAVEQVLSAPEETHVVADGSDDPEHVDDCPGCNVRPVPAATEEQQQ